MIAIKCPTHGSRVLLTERHIRRLVNTERGIFVDVECTCGTHVMLKTGRKAKVAA